MGGIRVRTHLVFTIMTVAGLLIGGCTQRVTTFEPIAKGVHATSATTRTGPCPFVDRTGTGSLLALQWQEARDAGATGVLAGYSNVLYPGADPAPCNTWIHHEIQGLIVFNTSGLVDRAVVNARLDFTARAFTERDGRTLRLANCGFLVESADVVWPVGLSTGLARIPARPTRPESGPFNMTSLASASSHSFDVTTTVSEWLRGARGNFGFAITANRPFVNELVARYCTAMIDNARLEVTIAER